MASKSLFAGIQIRLNSQIQLKDEGLTPSISLKLVSEGGSTAGAGGELTAPPKQAAILPREGSLSRAPPGPQSPWGWAGSGVEGTPLGAHKKAALPRSRRRQGGGVCVSGCRAARPALPPPEVRGGLLAVLALQRPRKPPGADSASPCHAAPGAGGGEGGNGRGAEPGWGRPRWPGPHEGQPGCWDERLIQDGGRRPAPASRSLCAPPPSCLLLHRLREPPSAELGAWARRPSARPGPDPPLPHTARPGPGGGAAPGGAARARPCGPLLPEPWRGLAAASSGPALRRRAAAWCGHGEEKARPALLTVRGSGRRRSARGGLSQRDWAELGGGGCGGAGGRGGRGRARS
ncbi:uncharacterized protein RBU57_013122 [Macrochelys suwanniensis]